MTANKEFECEYEIAPQTIKEKCEDFDQKSNFTINTKQNKEEEKKIEEPKSPFYLTGNPETDKENEVIYNLIQKKLEEQPPFIDKNWRLWEEKKDLQYKLYYFEEKIGIRSLKAEIVIDLPIKPIYEYIDNVENKYVYDKMFESGHEVRKVNDEIILTYQKYKGKMGFEPRDYYVLLYKHFDEENLEKCNLMATSFFASQYKDVPGCVRATLYMGGFFFKKLGDNKTLVTFYTFSDLKISNFFMKMALPDIAKCLIYIKEQLYAKKK